MKGEGQVGGLQSWRGWFVGLAIGSVVAVGASVFLQGSALKQDRAGAETRATSYASQVVEPAFGGEQPTAPITGEVQADLTARLQEDVFAVDDVVDRVRVWAPSGELLFSTDEEDQAGQTKSDNLDAIKAAVKNEGVVTATLVSGPEPRLTIFVPLRLSGPPSGAVEIDDDYVLIVANARQPWGTARTVAIGLAVLFGLLTLVSFVPIGRAAAQQARGRAVVDEGHPQPTSAPSNPKPPGSAPSNREQDRMRSKLEKSEQGRKALETELEQLRLQIGRGRDESTGRIRELEEQLSAANARVKEVSAFTPASEHQTRIQELEQVLADATTRTEQIEAKALDLTSNVTHSESMALRMQAEAEDARRELASVASRVALADSKAAEAEMKANDAETAKSEMKARLEKLEEELRWSQAQQVETQPLLHEASGRLQEAKSRADEALARATKMEERALDAEAAASRLEERLAQAEVKASQGASAGDTGTAGRTAELATELAAVNAQNAESATRAAELERMLEASVTRGEQLAERTSDLELRLKGSSDATRQAVANAEAAAAELATARAQLSELEATAASSEARASELESKLQMLESESARQVAAAEARATQAEGGVRELSSRLQESEVRALEVSQKADTGSAAKSRIRTLEQALESARTRARELAQQADDLREDNTGAQSRLTDVQGQAEATAAELQEALERATQAEARASEAETREAEADSQESSGEQLAAALARVAELEAQNSHVEGELEKAQTRLHSVYAELEAAQAQAAEAGNSDGIPEALPQLASLQAEVDRLTGELARTIEGAHVAEEKGARLEAELVAMRRAAANGDDPSGGSSNGFNEPPAPSTSGASTTEEAPSDEPAGEGWETSEPSLRARLARTAARKKGRTRGEDGSLWPS